MNQPRRVRLAVTSFTITAGMLVAIVAFAAVQGAYGDPYAALVYACWSLIGVVLAVRRPANRIGWLFLVAALCWTTSAVAGHYALYGVETAPGSLPAPALAVWIATWIWLPGLVLLPTFGLLLFPDGQLPSPRWRWPARGAAAGIVLGMLAYTVAPWRGSDEFAFIPGDLENPLHGHLGVLHEPLLAAALALILLGIGTGVLSLVVRYRSATAAGRQQLKWAVAGGIGSVTVYLTGDLTTRLPGVEWWLVTLVAALVFPASILVAVLRFRLYDIDRLVSRTVAYLVLSALLAGVYAAGVVGLGGLVRSIGGGGGDLVVAASTLAVAAVFVPARRRIQALVDRRFNRARYDAERTVEAFAQGLRDEVELEAVRERLATTASEVIQPCRVEVWLPSGGGPGR